MSHIKQLSKELIKKIAAGEVIDRPASVVKELVENSIDAGATRVEIEVKRGGKDIKVLDDGKGILKEDIPLLFERHATSKLEEFDDLWGIETLGFRGEALSSISGVSKIKCTSKNEGDDCGFELNLTDGKQEIKSSGISKGTVFEISDLFYNIPAREKFLKAESTEVGHILDIVLQEAISHPDVAIKLTSNKSTVLETSGSGSQTQVIVECLGRDLEKKLVEVKASSSVVSISGFISNLEISRSNRKQIFLFINKRPVKCPILTKAVMSAYEGMLAPGKFPIIVLDLNFKPGMVDVNVHPTKKEVRYTNPTETYNFLQRTIQNEVSKHYKDKYEEKSEYSLNLGSSTPESDIAHQNNNGSNGQASLFKKEERKPPQKEYSEAAFDFYKPSETQPENEQAGKIKPSIPSSQDSISLLNVRNLKFDLISSTDPIANMTKVGNKTIFEVGTIFEDDVQVVASGEVIGDEQFQSNFFNGLADTSTQIYKSYKGGKTPIQQTIVSGSIDEEAVKKASRKKPNKEILYKIYERDNWTCVYCGKQLIDPEAAKKAVSSASEAFVSYLNTDGKEINVHVVKEHAATYDHHLPVSKLPQFNYDESNLYASCQSCNRKKSDSMETKAWNPERKNSWKEPLEIAKLRFESPSKFVSI